MDIYDLILSGRYTAPKPDIHNDAAKPKELGVDATDIDYENYVEQMKAYNKAKSNNKEQKKITRTKQHKLNEQFKQDALLHVGLSDYSKADKVFEYAWEKGNGLCSIIETLEDLAELIEYE